MKSLNILKKSIIPDFYYLISLSNFTRAQETLSLITLDNCVPYTWSDSVINKLNLALEQLYQNGIIQAITSKYVGT